MLALDWRELAREEDLSGIAYRLGLKARFSVGFTEGLALQVLARSQTVHRNGAIIGAAHPGLAEFAALGLARFLRVGAPHVALSWVMIVSSGGLCDRKLPAADGLYGLSR